MSELESVHCVECGLLFGIDKTVVGFWRKSHKQFLCPNGHTLLYKDPSPDEKELTALRAEVKALKAKLETALKDLETHKAEKAALVTELEIWKPTEEKVAES